VETFGETLKRREQEREKLISDSREFIIKKINLLVKTLRDPETVLLSASTLETSPRNPGDLPILEFRLRLAYRLEVSDPEDSTKREEEGENEL